MKGFESKGLPISQHIACTQGIRTCGCRRSSLQEFGQALAPHLKTARAHHVHVDALQLGFLLTKKQFVRESRRRASAGQPPHLRLCGDLTHLQDHINAAVTAMKRPKVCHVCGKPAYSKCGLCDVNLHYFSKRGANAGAECFLLYHSDAFFGLAKQDAIMVHKRKQDWVFPTNAAKRGNAAYIRRLVKEPELQPEQYE